MALAISLPILIAIIGACLYFYYCFGMRKAQNKEHLSEKSSSDPESNVSKSPLGFLSPYQQFEDAIVVPKPGAELSKGNHARYVNVFIISDSNI